MQQIQGLASKRTCKIADHNQKSTLQICSYEKCDKNTRWACVDCLKKNLHRHNSLDQGYLKDQLEFVQYLEKKKKEIQDHDEQSCKNIQDISQRLKSLLAEINDLIKFIYKLEQSKKNNNNVQSIQQMINDVKSDFFQVSDENANQIIQIKNNPNERVQYLKFDQFLNDCVHELKSFQINNTFEDFSMKQNLQQNQKMTILDRKQSLQNASYLIPTNQTPRSQKYFQNSLEQVQKQTNNYKEQNVQEIKQFVSSPLAQSQVQQVQSQNQIINKNSQIQFQKAQYFAQSQVTERQQVQIEKVGTTPPQPRAEKPYNQIQSRDMSQGQVSERYSAYNINNYKPQNDKVQIIQAQPIKQRDNNPQIQIQNRDMSQGRFFNPFQSPKTIQTANQMSQPSLQPKK